MCSPHSPPASPAPSTDPPWGRAPRIIHVLFHFNVHITNPKLIWSLFRGSRYNRCVLLCRFHIDLFPEEFLSMLHLNCLFSIQILLKLDKGKPLKHHHPNHGAMNLELGFDGFPVSIQGDVADEDPGHQPSRVVHPPVAQVSHDGQICKSVPGKLRIQVAPVYGQQLCLLWASCTAVSLDCCREEGSCLPTPDYTQRPRRQLCVTRRLLVEKPFTLEQCIQGYRVYFG